MTDLWTVLEEGTGITRQERMARLEKDICALRNRRPQKEEALHAEHLAAKRERIKAHVGLQVRYQRLALFGDARERRLFQQVGTLLVARRTRGVVDFGGDLGRWEPLLESLAPVEDREETA